MNGAINMHIKRICFLLIFILIFQTVSQPVFAGEEFPSDAEYAEPENEEELFFRQKAEEINELLEQNEIPAVLYLCSDYPLRSEPSEGSEEIVRIPCGTTLWLRKAAYRENSFFFLADVYAENETVISGYLPMSQFVCVNREFLSWADSLSTDAERDREDTGHEDSGQEDSGQEGERTLSVLEQQARDSVYSFPDEYRDALMNLWNTHSSWVFVPQDVSPKFSDALQGELDDNKSWISSSAPDEYKLRPTGQSGWYVASLAALTYYMNPKNFLTEKYVFQFEQLGYNGSYHTESGVQTILNNTFMSGLIPGDSRTYANAFMEIGRTRKVSPYHLASRVRQEQGTAGTSDLISGTFPGYEGYYNYFNVRASGATREEVIRNGLAHAREMGWDTRYKSLDGGAQLISGTYISAGQDTLYLEKFNVGGSTYAPYTHQYMQNIQAPSSESVSTYNQYRAAGTLENPFVFKIPVFSDMTKSPNPLTPDEQEQMENLEKTAKLYAVLNKGSKLSSVDLGSLVVPSGITVRWKKPDTVLTADDTKPIQNFPAVYKKTNGVECEISLPVHVTKLNSFTLTDITNEENPGRIKPADVLQGANEAVYEAKASATGYIPEKGTEEIGLMLRAQFSGKLKDGSMPVTVGSIVCTEKMKWKIRVGVPAESASSLTDQSTGTLKLTAGFYDSASGSGKSCLSASKNIRVEVLDNMPVLQQRSVEVSVWKKEGTSIGLLTQNGVSINSVRLYDGGAESDIFRIIRTDRGWELCLTDEARTKYREKKSKQVRKLTMQIEAGDGRTYQTAFTAAVAVAKPELKTKLVQKPNLFYSPDRNESEAEVLLSAPEYIESVSVCAASEEENRGSGKPWYTVKSFDKEARLLPLEPKFLPEYNSGGVNKKVGIEVVYPGYDPITYTFNISVVTRKPVVRVEKACLYGERNTGLIRLAGKDGRAFCLPEDTKAAENTGTLSLSVNRELGGLALQAPEGFKPGNYKMVLESKEWRMPLQLSVPVLKTEIPAIRLSLGSVRLNTALSTAENGTQDITARIEGCGDSIVINRISGTNTAAQDLLDKGYLSVNPEGNVLKLGLVPEKRNGLKTGKYSFVVDGILPENEGVIPKSARLTVSIEDKSPSAMLSFSRKGSIDLTDRADTRIVLTPKVTGLGSESINEISLDEDSSKLFTARLFKNGERLPDGTKEEGNGEILIEAREGASLYKSTTYTLTLNFALENRLKISRKITVKPIQSPQKTAGAYPKIYMPMNGDPAPISICAKGTTPNDSLIESVELLSDGSGQFFEFKPSESDEPSHIFSGMLSVSKTIRKTGTYSLRFRVKYKGHAQDLGPRTITVSVTVK